MWKIEPPVASGGVHTAENRASKVHQLMNIKDSIKNKTDTWVISDKMKDLQSKRNSSFNLDSLQSLMSEKKILEGNLESLRAYSNHNNQRTIPPKMKEVRRFS